MRCLPDFYYLFSTMPASSINDLFLASFLTDKVSFPLADRYNRKNSHLLATVKGSIFSCKAIMKVRHSLIWSEVGIHLVKMYAWLSYPASD